MRTKVREGLSTKKPSKSAVHAVFRGALLLVLGLWVSYAHAVTLDKRLAIPAQEARAVALFKQIRCISCSGESVYDSRSRLAKDFRTAIRTKISSGEEDAVILHYFTQRYGSQVLANPLPASHTFLWMAPLLFVVLGMTGALIYRRRS